MNEMAYRNHREDSYFRALRVSTKDGENEEQPEKD